MSKSIKSGGRDWQPGQSGNPMGRPRKDSTAVIEESKSAQRAKESAEKAGLVKEVLLRPWQIEGKARDFTKEEFMELINRYIHCDINDLKIWRAEGNLPAKDALAITLIVEGGYKGNPSLINTLLERKFGKIKETVELKMPAPTVIKRFENTQPILELGSAEVEFPDKT